MSETTPTPWARNGKRVENRDEHGIVNDGWIICDCDGPDAEANAQLIVTAVNSHSALVESVTNLLSLVRVHTGADDAVASAAVREAEAALSLAKGETSET